MNEMNIVEKYQPIGAILDYSFDWATWLVTGDTVVTSTWTISPVTPLTKVSEPFTTTVSTVWVSSINCVAGQSFTLKNTITTALGRTETHTFVLNITAV